MTRYKHILLTLIVIFNFFGSIIADDLKFQLDISFLNEKTNEVYRSKCLLVLYDANGKKTEYYSDSSQFSIQVTRNKYNYKFNVSEIIPYTNTLDFSHIEITNNSVIYMKTIVDAKSELIDSKHIEYVDSFYNLWDIISDYYSSIYIKNDEIFNKDSVIKNEIQWKGFCFAKHDFGITNGKDISSAITFVNYIKKDKLFKKDGWHAFEKSGYRFKFNVKSGKFRVAHGRLNYTSIIDCYREYLSIKKYLDNRFEHEEVVFSDKDKREFGIGENYFDNKNNTVISVIYGIQVKTSNEKPSPKNNKKIPLISYYFIDLEIM